MTRKARNQGPDAPGGFPTFEGVAEGKLVHWIGLKPKRADELEAQFATASPLLRLLMRNAYTLEGLLPDEKQRARDLIESVPETQLPCGVRTNGCEGKSIGDTFLCRAHNRYALENRN